MRRAIPPLPQYVFMAWCLIKHRDNFTFYGSGRLSFNIAVQATVFSLLHELSMSHVGLHERPKFLM
jgi:hypothetical protein